jgi:hypothetical protein
MRELTKMAKRRFEVLTSNIEDEKSSPVLETSNISQGAATQAAIKRSSGERLLPQANENKEKDDATLNLSSRDSESPLALQVAHFIAHCNTF